ncbi:MAG: protein prkA, partial [Acidobacteriota bacterium]
MSDVFEKLDAHAARYKAEDWNGTFRDYLSIVRANPRAAQLAHARIYEMVRSHGVETDNLLGTEKYLFFKSDLFGVDEALAQIMEYFKAASLGSDVGRRILMIYGPPSSGKSQFVILLKRGLEEYTRSPEGAAYAIADCPMHEEPLHLVPHSLRSDFLA